jgi:nicotinate-nucleotide adenylyltransferase
LENDLKRVGFFGGSFDPIHNGHLHLAIALSEKHQLDEVFFCPTGQSPHKKSHPPIASKEDRRGMVTAAIHPLPQFTLLDLELRKTMPCYTIDTIQELLAIDHQNKAKRSYFLLLGEDALEQFHTWREVEELVKLALPLIGSRDKKFILKKGPLSSVIEKGLTSIPILEISSTEIRARLEKGFYCGHLLPAKVWDYIQQHQLYKLKAK